MTLFLLTFFQFYIFPSYQLSPQVKSPGLDHVLKYFNFIKESKKIQTLVFKINKHTRHITIENLELLSQAIFYKSFLNNSPHMPATTSGDFSSLLEKLKSPSTDPLTKWLIPKLLQDLKETPKKSHKYLTPWLGYYQEKSTDKWQQQLSETSLYFLQQLHFFLETLNSHSRPDENKKQLTGLLIEKKITLPKKTQIIDRIEEKIKEKMPKTL